jgi:murein DD-endopeptidase MepM/ murein hydrolase activator NlpD
LERSSETTQHDLAVQIERVRQAYEKLPHISSESDVLSNFSLPSGWTTVCEVNITDGDKKNRNIVAYGNVHINDPGSGGGTGGFAWPFDLSLVTSEYGPRDGRFHEGIDFAGGAASAGNNIPSAGSGVVSTNTYGSGFGNYIIISHGNYGVFDLYTLYGHMQSPSPLSVGTAVSTGTTLGQVGNTGASFGPHLHFETHLVPAGGSMIFENYNPSYASARTSAPPRDFIAYYGGGAGPTLDAAIQCRLIIDGVHSMWFQRLWNLGTTAENWLYPVFGRTYIGSGTVNVVLQVYTTAGIAAATSNSATLSVEGLFTP